MMIDHEVIENIEQTCITPHPQFIISNYTIFFLNYGIMQKLTVTYI